MPVTVPYASKVVRGSELSNNSDAAPRANADSLAAALQRGREAADRMWNMAVVWHRWTAGIEQLRVNRGLSEVVRGEDEVGDEGWNFTDAWWSSRDFSDGRTLTDHIGEAYLMQHTWSRVTAGIEQLRAPLHVVGGTNYRLEAVVAAVDEGLLDNCTQCRKCRVWRGDGSFDPPAPFDVCFHCASRPNTPRGLFGNIGRVRGAGGAGDGERPRRDAAVDADAERMRSPARRPDIDGERAVRSCPDSSMPTSRRSVTTSPPPPAAAMTSAPRA
eukprot:gene5285-4233_t